MRSTLYAAALVCFSGVPLRAQSGPVTLQIDSSAGRHPIDPNIYGIVSYGLDPGFAKEIKVPNVRWGGNGTSRYNWQVDASNSGADWFFTGGNGQNQPVPSGSADAMIRTYKAAGAQSLMTIPILPYLNKSAAWNCSFPTAVYGSQQSVNPYVHPNGSDCGNSITLAGDQLFDSAIYSNHIENSPTIQMGWVQHLTNTFGAANQGGVKFYQLDNEPGGWSNTHRDVQPSPATYRTIASLGQQYAAAVKAVDPGALVFGPSDYSLGGWVGDLSQQNGLFAGQFYLQQMAAASAAQHTRLLDYFDEHYYPQFSSIAEQLAVSRTLWDGTYNGGTWVEQWAFASPMQLIPRLKGWIAQYYPGTKLAFTEYSVDSGKKTIVDALAEADVLGIFGREGVDFANMWNSPLPTDPVAYAFRLYRNFDGAGSQFGDTGVQATSSDQARLSIYAAQRSTDGVLTALVINKTATSIQAPLTLHTAAITDVKAYQYSHDDLTRIVPMPSQSFTAAGLRVEFPAYSATLFSFKTASQPIVLPCLRLRSSTYKRCGPMAKH